VGFVRSETWLEVQKLSASESGAVLLTSEELPPGHYHARIELDESHGWPAPMFWAPYDKPVVAETEFRIEAESEATSR
ncbi:MAG: hypothetical protein JSU68_01630, partial [Phycisphaerales bacterium]